MVDVGNKKETSRGAVARGRVWLGREAFIAVQSNALAKGDVLATARLAGIMAAKQTSHLIPLCHSLNLDRYLLKSENSADACKAKSLQEWGQGLKRLGRKDSEAISRPFVTV